MSLEETSQGNEPCILVEGPRWGDTAFYAKWLLAATKANALWKKAIGNPVFAKQIEWLTMVQIPDFNISATIMLSRLERKLASIVIGLDSEEVEDFAIMVGMGFFVLTGHRYQMVVPTGLNIGKVKEAALRLAQTADDEGLHPEYILAVMSRDEATLRQDRLREMDQDHRCADRTLALSANTLVKSRGVWWECPGIPLPN